MAQENVTKRLKKNLAAFASINLFVAILFSTGLASAKTLSCKQSKTPAFRLNTKIEKPIISQNISSKDLTEQRAMVEEMKPESHVLGTANPNLQTVFNASFSVKGLDGNYCIELKELKMEFIAKHEIHIANNFKKGSCEYDKILKHEQKHVRATDKFVKRYKSKFSSHMRKALKKLPEIDLIREGEIEQAQQTHIDFLQDEAKAFLEKIRPKLEDVHARIDTPEEYERTARKCGGNWQEQLLNE